MRVYSCVFLLISLGYWGGTGWAQSTPDRSELRVNYVYAGQLGFGAYELGGLSVQIYKLPLAYTFPFGKNQLEIFTAASKYPPGLPRKSSKSLSLFDSANFLIASRKRFAEFAEKL